MGDSRGSRIRSQAKAVAQVPNAATPRINMIPHDRSLDTQHPTPCPTFGDQPRQTRQPSRVAADEAHKEVGREGTPDQSSHFRADTAGHTTFRVQVSAFVVLYPPERRYPGAGIAPYRERDRYQRPRYVSSAAVPSAGSFQARHSGGPVRKQLPAFLRPGLMQAYRWRTRVGATPPQPVDEPFAHAPGLDPDRVLVFGNGLAVGWGVRIHDLALPGHLARALTTLTGRGAEVRARADPDMTITTAADAVSGTHPTSFDAAIVIIGASDAFQLISPQRWRYHMAALIRTLSEHAGGTPVMIVGISPVSSIPFFHTRTGGLIDQWAEQLNAITRDLCENSGAHVSYLPPHLQAAGPGEAGRRRSDRYRGPEQYRDIAQYFAAALQQPLHNPSALEHHEQIAAGEQQPDQQRHAALAALGILDTAPEERFDHVVQMARTVFGTEGAAFTLLDDHRQWHKASIGTTTPEDPLEDSFCATTIRAATPFVVPDAWNEDRPVPHTHVRFYAGYPVEAPDGTRIGAICVFDRDPKTATTVQLSFLRELALTLQHELTHTPTLPPDRTQAPTSNRPSHAGASASRQPPRPALPR